MWVAERNPAWEKCQQNPPNPRVEGRNRNYSKIHQPTFKTSENILNRLNINSKCWSLCVIICDILWRKSFAAVKPPKWWHFQTVKGWAQQPRAGAKLDSTTNGSLRFHVSRKPAVLDFQFALPWSASRISIAHPQEHNLFNGTSLRRASWWEDVFFFETKKKASCHHEKIQQFFGPSIKNRYEFDANPRPQAQGTSFVPLVAE